MLAGIVNVLTLVFVAVPVASISSLYIKAEADGIVTASNENVVPLVPEVPEVPKVPFIPDVPEVPVVPLVPFVPACPGAPARFINHELLVPEPTVEVTSTTMAPVPEL